MTPIDTSGLAKYLGPGTGGLWMGEQQRNAMQESQINQQKGLEDIMTQQQTRDIQRQKLPWELQQAEATVGETKGRIAKQKSDEEDRLQKLDKQNVSDFMGAILQYQGVDNPLDNAFQLQALAQKYKLDPNDPRIRSIMSNSMDKQGIKKMQDALIQSDPKWIADRKKALEDKEKSDSEIQGRKDVAHITGGYSVQRANIQAAAKAAAQAKTQSILQITKGDPVKTIAALVTEGNRLLKEGKVDEANALFEAANDPVLRTAASNQQANAGKLTGASAPLPQAGPPAAQPGVPPGAPQPAAPAPQAAPQGATKTATGPGGVKIFLVNGQWVNAQGQPVQ
jgi:hypothetical protein